MRNDRIREAYKVLADPNTLSTLSIKDLESLAFKIEVELMERIRGIEFESEHEED